MSTTFYNASTLLAFTINKCINSVFNTAQDIEEMMRVFKIYIEDMFPFKKS